MPDLVPVAGRAAVVLALLSATAAPARADLAPKGRIAAVGGIRSGTGSLDDRFGLGALYGIEAAWEPLPDGHRIGYAIHWNVLFGDFGSDSTAITGGLDIVEMAIGARVRLAPRRPSQSIFLGGGAATLRANTPLPPDDERSYVGGFAGGGLELIVLGKVLITLEARFGLIGAGPGSASALLGVGLGV